MTEGGKSIRDRCHVWEEFAIGSDDPVAVAVAGDDVEVAVRAVAQAVVDADADADDGGGGGAEQGPNLNRSLVPCQTWEHDRSEFVLTAGQEWDLVLSHTKSSGDRDQSDQPRGFLKSPLQREKKERKKERKKTEKEIPSLQVHTSSSSTKNRPSGSDCSTACCFGNRISGSFQRYDDFHTGKSSKKKSKLLKIY